jgi:sensor histidine kinase YesM
MNSMAVPTATRPRFFGSPGGRGRWFEGIGVTGLLIVAGVALITSINNVAGYIVTEPLASWFPEFLDALTRNGIMALAVLLTAVWVRNRFPSRGFLQYAAVAGAIAVVTAVVWVSFVAFTRWVDGEPFYIADPTFSPARQALFVGTKVLRYSAVGIVITGAWLYLCTQAEHAAAVEQCAIDAEQMDRQTAEARLQALEAQIEPHFLFNTLAHVKRLYDTDRAAGARMLHDLASYLAGALPQMRAASTLGRELDHVRAYLNIQQIRMGRRLAFSIDVPEALRDAPLPPLMVLTLVENAIKHGEPLARAAISPCAPQRTGPVAHEVSDTAGFKTGGGMAANICARLASQCPAAGLAGAHRRPASCHARVRRAAARAGQ